VGEVIPKRISFDVTTLLGFALEEVLWAVAHVET